MFTNRAQLEISLFLNWFKLILKLEKLKRCFATGSQSKTKNASLWGFRKESGATSYWDVLSLSLFSFQPAQERPHLWSPTSSRSLAPQKENLTLLIEVPNKVQNKNKHTQEIKKKSFCTLNDQELHEFHILPFFCRHSIKLSVKDLRTCKYIFFNSFIFFVYRCILSNFFFSVSCVYEKYIFWVKWRTCAFKGSLWDI